MIHLLKGFCIELLNGCSQLLNEGFGLRVAPSPSDGWTGLTKFLQVNLVYGRVSK
jgi:hypothetical protein